MNNQKETKSATPTPKIYESPDKGKTVYEREIGAPHRTRVKIKG